MSQGMIELLKNGIRIEGLDISSTAIAEYLRDFPEEERTGRFVEAAEIGVFCLERAGNARDLEFVRRQVEALMKQVQEVMGELPRTLEAEFAAKMGDGDGQVLAPVRVLIEGVNTSLTDRIKDVRELLAEDLDPARATSTLGSALSKVGELFDPQRKDSIQSVLADAVRQLADGDGALATAVKTWVGQAVEPLEDEVNRLARQMASADAVDDALQNTTKKGTPYELQVVDELQAWGARMGVVVEHVGSDNKPGDVISSSSPSRPSGRLRSESSSRREIAGSRWAGRSWGVSSRRRWRSARRMRLST